MVCFRWLGEAEVSYPYFSEQNTHVDDEFITNLDAVPRKKRQGVPKIPKTGAFRVGDSGKAGKACGVMG